MKQSLVHPTTTAWRGSVRAAPGHGRGRSRRCALSWCDRRLHRPSPPPRAPRLRLVPCQGKQRPSPTWIHFMCIVTVLSRSCCHSATIPTVCCVDVAQVQIETCVDGLVCREKRGSNTGAQVQHGAAVGVDGRDLAVVSCVDGAEGGVQRMPRSPRRQRRACPQQKTVGGFLKRSGIGSGQCAHRHDSLHQVRGLT